MKKLKQKSSKELVAEILTNVVCEKNDLVWTLPFTQESYAQILKELFVRCPLSDN